MKKAGNRGGSSKKTAPVSTSNEDTSYIIFSDAESEKKAKKSNQADPTPPTSGANDAASAENAQKKPDTRKLIGGASWTGKLPVNMLSEHCQKQKWAKPEYTMVCLGKTIR